MKDIQYKRGLIRVQISEYQDKKYLDIRKFYIDEGGEPKPTRKGITLSPDIAEEILKAGLKELDNLFK